MTDETASKESEPEYGSFYRGYVLKVTQNRETKIWTLSYNLGAHSPVISKLEFGNARAATDHGQRMIDFLLGE